MQLDFQSEKPIFIQIAETIEDGVFTGAFPEETQLPSTTEISTRFRINPATALKGITLLVDQGIVYKKRGVGMFVREGAVETIRKRRQEDFYENYILSMLEEAKKLGLNLSEIQALVERGMNHGAD